MKRLLTATIFVLFFQFLNGQITINTFPTPLDIFDECILTSPETHPEVDNYFITNGGGLAESDCGIVNTPWEIGNVVWEDFGCGNWNCDIEWIITDDCGSDTLVEMGFISIMETQSPYFTEYPEDITINCGNPNNQMVLDNWISNLGGAVVEIPCDFVDLDTVINYLPYQISCPSSQVMEVEFEIFSSCSPGDLATAQVFFLSSTIEFSSPQESVSEASTSIEFCFESMIDLFYDVEVEVTLDGSSTATNGTDFGPINTVENYTFVAGPPGTQCFSFNMIEDVLVEPSESILLQITNLSSPTNEELIGPQDVLTVNIIDNDDNDLDGVENTVDNCPDNYNPFQEDIDADTIGDVCDTENTVSQFVEIQDNLYLNKIYSGVIMKDQSNKCWMLTVQENGDIKTTLVTCPN